MIDKYLVANYGNFENYRIVDIDFTKTPMSLMNQRETFMDYYAQKFGIHIKN